MHALGIAGGRGAQRARAGLLRRLPASRASPPEPRAPPLLPLPPSPPLLLLPRGMSTRAPELRRLSPSASAEGKAQPLGEKATAPAEGKAQSLGEKATAPAGTAGRRRSRRFQRSGAFVGLESDVPVDCTPSRAAKDSSNRALNPVIEQLENLQNELLTLRHRAQSQLEIVDRQVAGLGGERGKEALLSQAGAATTPATPTPAAKQASSPGKLAAAKTSAAQQEPSQTPKASPASPSPASSSQPSPASSSQPSPASSSQPSQSSRAPPGYWEVDSAGNPLDIFERRKTDPENGQEKEDGKNTAFHIWRIETEAAAHELVERINNIPPEFAILGCDTEAVIDIKNETPVGHGQVTCVSIAFPQRSDFVLEDSPAQRHFEEAFRRLDEIDSFLPPHRICAWVDVYGERGERAGLLDIIAPVLEAQAAPRKAWHNYSFDRHVLFNHKVDCHGLAGDTMHMGRLAYNGRKDGYSLASLSKEYIDNPELGKISMKELFGVPTVLKNGTLGKTKVLPPINEIQVGPEREAWIGYSCLDSVACLELYFKFREKLATQSPEIEQNGSNLFAVYEKNLVPFAQVLTDIEREGVQIDVDYLHSIAAQGTRDLEGHMDAVREWVRNSGALVSPEDAEQINFNSTLQRAALIHSYRSEKSKSSIPEEDPTLIRVPGSTPSTPILVRGLKLPVVDVSPTGMPRTGAAQLQALAGKPHKDPPEWGQAYDVLKGAAGEDACRGLHELVEAMAVEKLLKTFIEPLIERANADEHKRVHTSLNLNTDTGRLSARNPNLQNQPALEKDRYKIRKAFVCRPNHNLIVADYGQLELRVLAHLAGCKSMIDAFIAGGDFHSRTALSMFDYIANDKEVILEWDKAANGGKPPPFPLIKDKYASERRQAKVLNFSIAYGKTAFGLAKDFGVSVEDAQAIVDRWYNARPEVRKWQADTIKFCQQKGYVETIWGRRRPLENINNRGNSALRRADERAAINTPIQGSAADIVMSAMNNLHANKRFRELGWRMVLQVHDEIVAEGPEESTDEAMEILRHCMENPLNFPLRVDMIVDANAAKDWYEAK